MIHGESYKDWSVPGKKALWEIGEANEGTLGIVENAIDVSFSVKFLFVICERDLQIQKMREL